MSEQLIVDISGWKTDEANSPYPEGTRDKIALISPPHINDSRIVCSHRYLLKFSNPRYSVQFWSEIIAKLVADRMGVECPQTFYSIDPKTSQPGSLISWFYGENLEKNFQCPIMDFGIPPETYGPHPEEVPDLSSLYVSGSSYMARIIKDFDFKRGKNHNLKSLTAWITLFRRDYKFDYWPHWISVFCFDAIIGNTDRHQDNWGVLWRKWTLKHPLPRFSPAFDNGTSLLHEITENNIEKFSDPDFLDRYILRGTHHIRFEAGQPRGAGHFDLIRSILSQREHLLPFAQSVLSFDEELLFFDIQALTEIDGPVRLTQSRATAICRVIGHRLKILREEFIK